MCEVASNCGTKAGFLIGRRVDGTGQQPASFLFHGMTIPGGPHSYLLFHAVIEVSDGHTSHVALMMIALLAV
jgi:hypothetical protein